MYFPLRPLFIIGLCVGIMLLFSNTLGNEFTNWDDDINITNNPYIQTFSWHDIRNLFTSPFADRYMPLAMVSFALDIAAGGLSPSVFHVTNIALHIAATLLVFLFVFQLIKRFDIAFLTSLFFSIHPNTVESVTWMSARSTPLFTCFYLGSLICSIQYTIYSKRQYWYILSLGLFLFSLLSKPAAVTLPLILLLLDAYFGRFKMKYLWEKALFFLFSFLFGAITLSFRGVHHLFDATETYTFFERIALASYALITYLVKVFYPYVTPPYTIFPAKIYGMLPPVYYFSITGIAVCFLVVLRILQKRPEWKKIVLFGIGFFLITIFISLDIIPMGNPDYSGERYTYLPYVGLFFILSSLVVHMLSRKWSLYMRMLVLFFLCVFSIITYQRNVIWRDSATLWNTLLASDPNNYEAYFGIGNMKKENGDFEGALSDYTRVIELQPNLAKAYNERGICKRWLGDYDGAIEDYTKALSIRPNYAKAYYNRGFVKEFVNDTEGAMSDYTQALMRDSGFSVAYASRSLLRIKAGDIQGGCDDARLALSAGNSKGIEIFSKHCGETLPLK